MRWGRWLSGRARRSLAGALRWPEPGAWAVKGSWTATGPWTAGGLGWQRTPCGRSGFGRGRRSHGCHARCRFAFRGAHALGVCTVIAGLWCAALDVAVQCCTAVQVDDFHAAVLPAAFFGFVAGNGQGFACTLEKQLAALKTVLRKNFRNRPGAFFRKLRIQRGRARVVRMPHQQDTYIADTRLIVLRIFTRPAHFVGTRNIGKCLPSPGRGLGRATGELLPRILQRHQQPRRRRGGLARLGQRNFLHGHGKLVLPADLGELAAAVIDVLADQSADSSADDAARHHSGSLLIAHGAAHQRANEAPGSNTDVAGVGGTRVIVGEGVLEYAAWHGLAASQGKHGQHANA